MVFYRDGLGLRAQSIVGTDIENGAVAFFNLQAGLKLALWPRKSIAADTGLEPSACGGSAGYFQDPDKHVWEVVFNPAIASLR